MQLFRKERLLDLALGFLLPFSIAFFALWKILFTPGSLMFVDVMWTYDLPSLFSQLIPAWNWYASSPNGVWTYVYIMKSMVLFWLGFSPELSQKLVFFGEYVLSGVCMYFAMRILLPKKEDDKLPYYASCVVASVCYMINRLALTSIQYTMAGYAPFPLAIALYIKTLREDRNILRNSFLVALLLSVVFSGFAAFLLVAAVIMVVYQIFHIVTRRNLNLLTHLKKDFLIIISFVLLNIYWFFPMNLAYIVSTGEPTVFSHPMGITSVTIEEFSYFSKVPLVDILTLNIALFSIPETMLWLRFLIPVTALLPMLSYIRDRTEAGRMVMFHAVSLLILVFFAMREPPLDEALYFFVRLIAPTGGLLWQFFRNSSFFYMLIPYPLAFLTAMLVLKTLTWISRRVSLFKDAVMGFEKTHLRSDALRFLRITTLTFLILVPALALAPWMLYTSYPLSGNINNQFVPVEIPQEYRDVDVWIRNRGGFSRVWWLPQPMESVFHFQWGSSWHFGPFPNPNVIPSEPYLWPSTPDAGKFVSYVYVQEVLHFSKSHHLGKILSVAGVKHIALHSDTRHSQFTLYLERNDELERVLRNLQNQKDLKHVYSQSFINAFENQENIPYVYASSNIALAVGGLNVLTALSELDSFNPQNHVLIFSEQLASPLLRQLISLSDTVFFSDCKGIKDLYLQLNENDFVYPSKYTIHGKPDEFWSQAKDLFLYLHRLSQETGKHFDQEGDFLYGDSAVLTSAVNATINVTVDVMESGLYEVWMRVLRSPISGRMSVYLDGTYVNTVNTNSSHAYLSWELASSTPLDKGSHVVTLKNDEGSNAVNVIQVASSAKLDSIRREVLDTLQGKGVITVERRLLDASEKVDQSQSNPNIIRFELYGDRTIAQSFTPQVSKMSGLGIYLTRLGNPEDLVIELYQADVDGSLHPEVCASAIIQTEKIAEGYHSGIFYRFSFEYEGLTIGKKYWIVLKQKDYAGDPSNSYHILYVPSDYVGGFMMSSNNQGTTYTAYPSHNVYFSTYYLKEETTYNLEEASYSRTFLHQWNLQNGSLQEIKQVPTIPNGVKVANFGMPHPGKYVMQVEANEPFILVIPENYNILWRTSIDQSIHLPGFSFLNAYYIEKTGEYDIVVEYTANKYFEVGIWGSFLFLIGFALVLTTHKSLRTMIRRIIKSN